MTNFEKVIEFHKKFNCTVGKEPSIPTPDRVLLRIRLIIEECAEVIEAISKKDIENLAKELSDLLYVVYGTGAEFGIDLDAVFAEVHKSNMTKSPAKDSGGKVVKGSGYVPPDIKLQSLIS